MVAVEILTEILAVKAMDAERKNLYIVSTQSLIKSIHALLLH